MYYTNPRSIPVSESHKKIEAHLIAFLLSHRRDTSIFRITISQLFHNLFTASSKDFVMIRSIKTDGLPTFVSLSEACQAGVDAEIIDAELYYQL